MQISFLKPLFTSLFVLVFWLNGSTQNWHFETLAPMPEPVANNAVAEGFDGNTTYLYSFGGIDSTKDHDGIHLRSFRYNFNTNTWETIAPLPDTLGKIAAGASRVGDVIYIIGGYHVFANSSEASSVRVHRYDIATNTYLSDGADIPVAIDDQVQAVYKDSLIFVVTGWSDVNNVEHVQIYDPANDNWLVGTPVPNNGIYESFGASGTIIGDTLYYYGGARFASNFPIQNRLRKGYIDPTDPTQITWSDKIPDPNLQGYRMASTSFDGKAVWIGGSDVTYNFDGIAYNSSGGVSPNERIIFYDPATGSFTTQTLPGLPMDLRGYGDLGASGGLLAGGMEMNQKVSDRTLWLHPYPVSVEQHFSKAEWKIFPNPAHEAVSVSLNRAPTSGSSLEIIDLFGRQVYRNQLNSSFETIPLSDLINGVYHVLIKEEGRVSQQLLIKH